jgi:hypothetical protein
MPMWWMLHNLLLLSPPLSLPPAVPHWCAPVVYVVMVKGRIFAGEQVSTSW